MNTRQSLLTKAKSPWALLLVALLIAGGISLMTFKYLEGRELRIKEEAAAQAAGRRTPEVQVVVPVADAGIGTLVGPQTFAARSIPDDLLYQDTIKASDFEFFTGQKLAKPLQKGRPLRISDLMAPEVRDVAAVVPSGKRAVTIAIDNLNSIAQTVRPGNLLDLFLISRAPNTVEGVPEQALDQASLFMQSMEVLAVGRDFNDPRLHEDLRQNMARPGEVQGADARDYDTVTLLVTPAQAAKLMVGQKMGSYRVALRGRNDDAAIQMSALKAGDFLPMPAKGGTDGIEFIVGGQGGGADMVSVRATPGALNGGVAAPAAAAINPLSAEALETALRNIAQPGSRGDGNSAARTTQPR